MKSDGDTTAQNDPANEDFEEVLDEIAELIFRGDQIDGRTLKVQFPQHAEQIESLLPALRSMVSLGIAGDGGISKHHKRWSPIDTSVAGGSISLGGVDADTSLWLESSAREKRIGDFQILRRIGSGGMGVVYEAQQISMGRRVALKVLPLAALVQERGVQRFHNEVRAVAVLDHPNIVSVYSVGEERGVHYFAMQLIQGQTMSAVIQALKTTRANGAVLQSDDIASAATPLPLDPPSALANASETISDERSLGRDADSSEIRPTYFQSLTKLGVQAASAVQHAHDHGILHRDIKPGNLMIDSKGQLFVTDFGLARMESEAAPTGTGNIIGTLRYMSPEQASGKGVVDYRCDIYALGVTLYELFTLRPPFVANDRKELIRKIVLEDPPRPRAINRDIPVELQNIVLKAIEKDPANRYASARELEDDLRAFLEFRPIKAKAPSVPQLVAKWMHRHRSLVRAVAATLVFACLVAGTMLWRESGRTHAALEIAKSQRQVAEQRHREAEQERAASRALLYGSDMKLASEAYQEGDVPLVWSLLERHRPRAGQTDLRDFAWHYLHRHVTAQRKWRKESGVAVNASDISPSGKRLALGLENNQVRILDVATGEVLRKFQTSDAVNAVSWGSDDQGLAVGSADGQVSIWTWTEADEKEDEQLDPLALKPSVSASGSALDSGQAARLLPQRTFTAHKRDTSAILWVAEQDLIVTGSEEGEIKTWKLNGSEDALPLEGHRARINELAISPNGKTIASASHDGTVRTWDLKTRKAISSWDSPSRRRFRSVDFSEDGTYLAAADSDGALLVVNFTTNKETVLHHLDWIESVRFLGPGRVATGDRGGSIHIWNVTQSLSQNRRLSAESGMMWSAQCDRVQTLAVVPGSSALIASGRDGTVTRWNADDRSRQTEFTTASGFAIGYDETLLACHHGLFQYDLHSHTHRTSLLAQPEPWELIASALESPWVVTANADGRVTVTDWLLGDTVAAWTVKHAPEHIAISPSGKYVAISSREQRKHVQLFDVENPKKPFLLPARSCQCITFHPDGQSIAIGSKEDLLIFQLSALSAPLKLKGHDANLHEAAYSHDGQYIATVSCDRSLKLWDADLGVLLNSTEAHTGEATSVSFSSDGSTIATSGRDASIRLWRAESLHPLLEIEAKDSVEQVQFASGDRQLIARLNNDEIHLFDSTEESYWPGSFSSDTAKGASLVGLGSAQYAISYSVNDVSNDGATVIGDYVTSRSEYRAFHWSKQNGLNPLPLPLGFHRSDAFRLSKHGILGRFWRSNEDAKVGRWKSKTAAPTIDTYSYQYEFISVADVADATSDESFPQTAGYIRQEAGKQTVPFKFDGQQVLKLPIPEAFGHAMVRDVSLNGDVMTGMAWNGTRWARSHQSRDMRIVQWRDGAVKELPGFGKGPFNWFATNASSDGRVVIGFRWRQGKPFASDQALAFRWENGVVQMIGELPGGRPISIVEDASEDGRVIVGYSESSRRKTAFVWDKAHGMRPLKSVLMQYRVPTARWRLESALSISPNGRHIAGIGIDPQGNPQPYLATLPPEAFSDE